MLLACHAKRLRSDVIVRNQPYYVASSIGKWSYTDSSRGSFTALSEMQQCRSTPSTNGWGGQA